MKRDIGARGQLSETWPIQTHRLYRETSNARYDTHYHESEAPSASSPPANTCSAPIHILRLAQVIAPRDWEFAPLQLEPKRPRKGSLHSGILVGKFRFHLEKHHLNQCHRPLVRVLSWALRSRSPPSAPRRSASQVIDYIQLVVRRRSDPFAPSQTALVVESRCGAVAVGPSQLLPPLSSGGVAIDEPWLRFHIPLIEPDGPD